MSALNSSSLSIHVPQLLGLDINNAGDHVTHQVDFFLAAASVHPLCSPVFSPSDAMRCLANRCSLSTHEFPSILVLPRATRHKMSICYFQVPRARRYLASREAQRVGIALDALLNSSPSGNPCISCLRALWFGRPDSAEDHHHFSQTTTREAD
ncbi:hypothetical protein B0H19DRAFT_1084485 [Mycena capillaripes]|nr:hypothetical protein B0H19DRAFT_1084485 [Mycena capillaripes]